MINGEVVRKLIIIKKLITEAAVRRCSSKKVLLKTLQYSQEATMLEAPFNKVASLKICNFIKKRLQHRCFPLKIAKFLRTPIFTEHLRWLLQFKSSGEANKWRI